MSRHGLGQCVVSARATLLTTGYPDTPSNSASSCCTNAIRSASDQSTVRAPRATDECREQDVISRRAVVERRRRGKQPTELTVAPATARAVASRRADARPGRAGSRGTRTRSTHAASPRPPRAGALPGTSTAMCVSACAGTANSTASNDSDPRRSPPYRTCLRSPGPSPPRPQCARRPPSSRGVAAAAAFPPRNSSFRSAFPLARRRASIRARQLPCSPNRSAARGQRPWKGVSRQDQCRVPGARAGDQRIEHPIGHLVTKAPARKTVDRFVGRCRAARR